MNFTGNMLRKTRQQQQKNAASIRIPFSEGRIEYLVLRHVPDLTFSAGTISIRLSHTDRWKWDPNKAAALHVFAQ